MNGYRTTESDVRHTLSTDLSDPTLFWADEDHQGLPPQLDGPGPSTVNMLPPSPPQNTAGQSNGTDGIISADADSFDMWQLLYNELLPGSQSLHATPHFLDSIGLGTDLFDQNLHPPDPFAVDGTNRDQAAGPSAGSLVQGGTSDRSQEAIINLRLLMSNTVSRPL